MKILILLMAIISYSQVISSASHDSTHVRIIKREMMGRLYMLYFNVFQVSHDSVVWQDDTAMAVTNESPFRCVEAYANLTWVRDRFMCTHNHSREIWYSATGTGWKRNGSHIWLPEGYPVGAGAVGNFYLYEFKSVQSGRYDVRGSFTLGSDSITKYDMYYYSMNGGDSWLQCAGENWNTRIEGYPVKVARRALRKHFQYSYDILGRRINTAVSGVAFKGNKKILIVR